MSYSSQASKTRFQTQSGRDETLKNCVRDLFPYPITFKCLYFLTKLQFIYLFIYLFISDKGIMAQPDIKQEPLSPGDRMMASCSQEIDLEEVTSFKTSPLYLSLF